MIDLHRGDQVKLTDRFANTLMDDSRSRRVSVDWRKRRGIVHHVNDHAVCVIWDGRTSYDQLPCKAVEKVGGENSSASRKQIS